MSAETADNAGTPQLRQFHMVNTKMFYHPNYYKNLRKLARLRNRDQAISSCTATAANERAPGTGHQASSIKLQASSQTKTSLSSETFKQQAASVKS